MTIYVVTRYRHDTWAMSGGGTSTIEKAFPSKAEAEKWIITQPKNDGKGDGQMYQYAYTYRIDECEMGIDLAVGYDMTNLTAYCGNCGWPVTPFEYYCSQCGTRLLFDMDKWNSMLDEIDKRRRREK